MTTAQGAETKATQSGDSRAGSRKPAPVRASPRPRSPRRFNSGTKQRFTLDRWRQLIAHLGREPSYPEQIVIGRVIAIEWDLRRTDARADAGAELSGHTLRARLAAETRLRLDLAALGLKAAAHAGPSLADHRARILAAQADEEDPAA